MTYAQAIRQQVQEDGRIKMQENADRLYRETGKELCIDCNGVDGHFSECAKSRRHPMVAQD